MRRGGRIILYHGWSDATFPALSTITYYNSVIAAIGLRDTNDGTGGINESATPVELAANRERHIASANRAQFASVNNGRPAVFSGRGVVAATAAGSRTTNIAANTNRPPNSARPTPNIVQSRTATLNSTMPSRIRKNNQTRAQSSSGANQSFADSPPSNAIWNDRAGLASGPLNATTDLKLVLGTVDRDSPAAHCMKKDKMPKQGTRIWLPVGLTFALSMSALLGVLRRGMFPHAFIINSNPSLLIDPISAFKGVS